VFCPPFNTFSPRFADLPDRSYFRLDPRADYGPLNEVARHRVNTQLIVDQWDDICRVAGTLHTRAATASQVIRSLQRAGQPTTLGRAIAEVGCAARTPAMFAYVTSEPHRRRILTQLNRRKLGTRWPVMCSTGGGAISTRPTEPARNSSWVPWGWSAMR
jgi:TnpA family transposase